MPYHRCSNCGTESLALLKNDGDGLDEPSNDLSACAMCGDLACGRCFLTDKGQCGQCLEASLNGLATEMASFRANVENALLSPSPYVRRVSRNIIKAAFMRYNIKGF